MGKMCYKLLICVILLFGCMSSTDSTDTYPPPPSPEEYLGIRDPQMDPGVRGPQMDPGARGTKMDHRGIQRDPVVFGTQRDPEAHVTQRKPLFRGNKNDPAARGFQRNAGVRGSQRVPGARGAKQDLAAHDTKMDPVAFGHQREPGARGTLKVPEIRGTKKYLAAHRAKSPQNNAGVRGFQRKAGVQGTQRNPADRSRYNLPGERGTHKTPGNRDAQRAPGARGTERDPESSGIKRAPGARGTQRGSRVRGNKKDPGGRGTQMKPGANGTQRAPGVHGYQKDRRRHTTTIPPGNRRPMDYEYYNDPVTSEQRKLWAAQKEKIGELKKYLMKLLLECADVQGYPYPIGEDFFEYLNKGEMIPLDENSRCLFACIFKTLGVLDQNGMMALNRTHEIAEYYLTPEEFKEAMSYTHQHEYVNEALAEDGARGCDRTPDVYKYFTWLLGDNNRVFIPDEPEEEWDEWDDGPTAYKGNDSHDHGKDGDAHKRAKVNHEPLSGIQVTLKH